MSELESIVGSILASYETGPRSLHHIGGYELPQQSEVQKCVETTRALLLPGFVGAPLAGTSPDDIRSYVLERLQELQVTLRLQVYRGLHHRSKLMTGHRALDCTRLGRMFQPRGYHVVVTSFSGAAASTSIDGYLSSHSAYFGSTRSTWVCCSMISDTRMWYGSSVLRHGRSRPWRPYQVSSRCRKRRRACGLLLLEHFV